MTASHEEGCDAKNILSHTFLFAKDCLSNDGVGVARGTAFQKIRPVELVLKPAISLKKSWGGYRVEQLLPSVKFVKLLCGHNHIVGFIHKHHIINEIYTRYTWCIDNVPRSVQS